MKAKIIKPKAVKKKTGGAVGTVENLQRRIAKNTALILAKMEHMSLATSPMKHFRMDPLGGV